MKTTSELSIELCSEIESLPAGEQQTKVSLLASQLSRSVADLQGWFRGRQEAEGRAHALFHAEMEIGDVENNREIDWATIHGPDEDEPEFFVKTLRTHLLSARQEIQRLRNLKNNPS